MFTPVNPGSDEQSVAPTPRDMFADFVALHLETRTHVPTGVMCRHLGRKEQTARCWACYEDGPIRPIRVHGRLAWPVAEIKRLLGVA